MWRSPTPGRWNQATGCCLGYYAQEHETLDPERSVLENLLSASPSLSESEARSLLGGFLFIGDTVYQPAGTLSGGEKTRLALACLVVSSANVLLLDEPTNNLDPASREEILAALRRYPGRDRAGHARRRSRRGAVSGTADPAARRRRGSLVGRLRRPGLLGLTGPRVAGRRVLAASSS